MKPLSLGDYGDLARHLRETGRQPSDLFEPGALEELGQSWLRVDIERIHRLLGRGFLLAEAMERWRARAIWVVTRAGLRLSAAAEEVDAGQDARRYCTGVGSAPLSTRAGWR